MATLREEILKILSVPDRELTYNRRLARYSNLSPFTPDNFTDIIEDNGPWFVHGLAFRMATFSLANENIFQRLNDLIEIAKQLDGWKNESKNTGLSWSNNYDKFFHFMWMLQCMEYFREKDCEVRFADTTNTKQPDLIIKPVSLNLIHPDLRIERTYNIKTKDQGIVFDGLLTGIGNILTPEKLGAAEKEASIKSPYLINESGNIRILLDGDGEYQASVNSHGDPTKSVRVYLNEIVKSKEKQNNLASYRPNILIVNGLGIDYQNVFFSNSAEELYLNSANIDRVELFACGIDARISECTRRLTVDRLCKPN